MLNATRKLFTHLWRGGQWAFLWTTHYNRSFWFRASDIPQVLKTDYPHCLFFGVHPVVSIPQTNARGQTKKPRSVRSQIAVIAALNCLYAELDATGPDGKAAALNTARLLTPPPSVIVDSGGGYHLYWLLDKPLVLNDEDGRKYANRLQHRWVKHITGADKGVCDIARVLRVPGSLNRKPKYAPDFPVVKFERWLNIEYDIHQLIAALPAEKSRRQKAYTIRNDNGDAGDHLLRVAEQMIARSMDGEKHTELLKAARLVGGGVAAGVLADADAAQALEAAIRAKQGVENISGAVATIAAGLDYGKAVPLQIE